jgi:hypothetical protein
VFDKAQNFVEKVHGKFCKKTDRAGELCSERIWGNEAW